MAKFVFRVEFAGVTQGVVMPGSVSVIRLLGDKGGMSRSLAFRFVGKFRCGVLNIVSAIS